MVVEFGNKVADKLLTVKQGNFVAALHKCTVPFVTSALLIKDEGQIEGLVSEHLTDINRTNDGANETGTEHTEYVVAGKAETTESGGPLRLSLLFRIQ
ncbi:hypothetical protein NDU88_002824 [Pleurodeles waltl]|uniref:Uncharacterized protein n=1 Tax=Pleurodeles waltl TaxID=8319 RepID=A0AAV7LDG7_PLEWA|nr:hypothetical protein NDU88_002824 [Pleurodeles waltl]